MRSQKQDKIDFQDKWSVEMILNLNLIKLKIVVF